MHFLTVGHRPPSSCHTFSISNNTTQINSSLHFQKRSECASIVCISSLYIHIRQVFVFTFCQRQIRLSKHACPRKYVHKGTRGRWMDWQLKGAMKAVGEQGISISAASKKFGIPKTTMFNHCTGK